MPTTAPLSLMLMECPARLSQGSRLITASPQMRNARQG
jgi:hypothetical protein